MYNVKKMLIIGNRISEHLWYDCEIILLCNKISGQEQFNKMFENKIFINNEKWGKKTLP